MSPATICIEPEILMRGGISASEIAESMVLASSAEQMHFERRHQFDLVVFYAPKLNTCWMEKDKPAEMAVQDLFNALAHLD